MAMEQHELRNIREEVGRWRAIKSPGREAWGALWADELAAYLDDLLAEVDSLRGDGKESDEAVDDLSVKLVETQARVEKLEGDMEVIAQSLDMLGLGTSATLVRLMARL